MAHVDLQRNRLILKVVLTGPPAVGKTERLEQVGAAGRIQSFGSSVRGTTLMASIDIETEEGHRPVELEIYEWHGIEKADVRAKGLFVGLDGLIYLADARADRWVDTQRQLEYVIDTAGKSKVRRLPTLLLVGQQDEGELAPASVKERLTQVVWSDHFDGPIDDAEGFMQKLRLFAEVVLARSL